MFIGQGTRGLKVKKLQYKLGISIDGIFGAGTESHVIDWQSNNGLQPTGEMHDVDWNYMFGCNVDEWTPIGIVVHSMSEFITYNGKELSAIDFLNEIGLSVHADIKPNGNVESMKLTNEKALHAGVSKWNGLSGLNQYFLGFEILVEGNNTYAEFLQKINDPNCYTESQYKSAVLLTRTWMEEYHISINDVVRHSDISGDDVRGKGKGKRDPGDGFNWEQFKKDIG